MIKYASNSHGFAVWHTPDKISLQGFFKSWQLCVSQMDVAWDQNTCSSVQEPAGVDLMSGQSLALFKVVFLPMKTAHYCLSGSVSHVGSSVVVQLQPHEANTGYLVANLFNPLCRMTTRPQCDKQLSLKRGLKDGVFTFGRIFNFITRSFCKRWKQSHDGT